MFVPANRAGFLTRLPVLKVRNIIIDLEYATRLPFKFEGRYLCKHAIAYLRDVRPDLFIAVRVNIPAVPRMQEEDLRIVVAARPDAIRIPSVNRAEEVVRVDELLSRFEAEQGIPEGTIKLHPMIETPAGLRNGAAIAAASKRNQALCLGGEDWAHNLGLARSRPGRELEYVKASIVSLAGEHQLVPVDSVYNWLDDLDGLRAETELSSTLGFRARATTNPRQLATITEIYAPPEDKIRWASRLLDSLTTVDVSGSPQYVCDGIITDPLAVHQAREVLRFVQSNDFQS
jgi:citrate lyase subunit beta/citryl-CoA lyase